MKFTQNVISTVKFMHIFPALSLRWKYQCSFSVRIKWNVCREFLCDEFRRFSGRFCRFGSTFDYRVFAFLWEVRYTVQDRQGASSQGWEYIRRRFFETKKHFTVRFSSFFSVFGHFWFFLDHIHATPVLKCYYSFYIQKIRFIKNLGKIDVNVSRTFFVIIKSSNKIAIGEIIFHTNELFHPPFSVCHSTACGLFYIYT